MEDQIQPYFLYYKSHSRHGSCQAQSERRWHAFRVAHVHVRGQIKILGERITLNAD